MPVALTLLLDAGCVPVFATVGGARHAEAHPVLGVLGTACPFLAGSLAGSLAWGWLAAAGRRRVRT